MAMEGYLWKAGELNKGWKERFFAIDPKISKLTYMKDKGSKKLGAIELKGAKIVLMPLGCEQRPGLLLGITPPSAKRTYLVEAANEAERSRWIRAMLAQGAISGGAVDGVGAQKIDIDTAQAPLKCGFLGKIGEKRKTRKIRYFVLYRQYLTYWEAPTMKKLLGRIPLYADSLAEKAPVKDEPWGFTVQESPNRRKYILLAQNERDRDEWLWALQISTESKKDERYTPKSVVRKGGLGDTTVVDPIDEIQPEERGSEFRRESEALFFQSKGESDFESEEELEEYDDPTRVDTTRVLAQFQNILVNDCSGSMQTFREAVGQFLILQEEAQSASKAREKPSAEPRDSD
jgi:hypothetical protein